MRCASRALAEHFKCSATRWLSSWSRQAYIPEPWPSCALPISQASTPPSSWYTDPNMLLHEQDTVFSNSWLIAGHINQFSSPGNFTTNQLLSLRYVVCRDQQQRINSFHNVCRHHAAAVAHGHGHCSSFVCPYHGWTYGLDGRLLKATRLRGIEHFKASQHGLVPLDVDTWGPFVFVRPQRSMHTHVQHKDSDHSHNDNTNDHNPTANTVSTWLGEGSDAALECGLRSMSDMQLVGERTWHVDCNWKVFCDNYLDGGYHVPFAHKGLASAVDMRTYTSTLHGHRVSIQRCGTGGITGKAGNEEKQQQGASSTQRLEDIYGHWMDVNIVRPLTHNTCAVDFWYFLDSTYAHDTTYIQHALAESAVVQQEDIALCRAVQEGLQSQAYDVGRYAPEVEHPMFHFHKMVCKDVMGGRA